MPSPAPRPAPHAPAASATPGPLVLGFAIGGGMLAWIVHLGGSYGLVPYVCASGHTFALHILTGAAALVAGAATWTAWWAWRRARGGLNRDGPGDPVSGAEGPGDPIPARSRDPRSTASHFLALFGLLLSGFFLVLIVVEGLPVLLQGDPCDAIPSPDRPIVRALAAMALPRMGRPLGRRRPRPAARCPG